RAVADAPQSSIEGSTRAALPGPCSLRCVIPVARHRTLTATDRLITAMPLTVYLATGLLAYLLGSIPFGYLLVRIFRKEDIRQKGSGNIGATNVLRSGAKGLGLATLLL